MSDTLLMTGAQYNELRQIVMPHMDKTDDRPGLNCVLVRTDGNGEWHIEASDSATAIIADGMDTVVDPEATPEVLSDERVPTTMLLYGKRFFSMRPHKSAQVRLSGPVMEGPEGEQEVVYITDGTTTVRLLVNKVANPNPAEGEKVEGLFFPDIPALAKGYQPPRRHCAILALGSKQMAKFAKAVDRVDFYFLGGQFSSPLGFHIAQRLDYRGILMPMMVHPGDQDPDEYARERFAEQWAADFAKVIDTPTKEG